mmetsp:Transcript_9105/g.28201  ORF Transcript_9105/g.28201 Transcript_9105/m.28201 type:complete len:221 (+) Transcript_9105:697-1359(+)
MSTPRCMNTVATTKISIVACKKITPRPVGLGLSPGRALASPTTLKPRTASSSSIQPVRPLNSNRNVSWNTPTCCSRAHSTSRSGTTTRHAAGAELHSRVFPPATLPRPLVPRLFSACRCAANMRCPVSSDRIVAHTKVNMPAQGLTRTSMAEYSALSAPGPAGGVTRWKRNATINMIIMKLSMSDHLPSASSAISIRWRWPSDSKRGGASQHRSMSRSLI